MFYVDTSAMVSALTTEAATQRVQHWIAAQPAGDVAISEWTITEFSAALSVKLRMGHLDSAEQEVALSAFRKNVIDSCIVLPISSDHFHSAARLADRHPLGLRAGDALHLAIAIENAATLCTLDRRLSEAGQAIGAETLLL
jgi:predicted nucleic acid-binding protein